mmetsp:Transcript_11185/g.36959  ORF Transcript_11185/g.36959 Transcript_11185/m.36959 type:complete len:453 (+) Transcript_11185:3-1361(+)
MMRRSVAAAAAAAKVIRIRPASRRQFESAAAYYGWLDRVVATKKEVNDFEEADGKEIAPFLVGVNPFAEHRLRFRRVKGATKGTSSFSCVDATWPISTDELVRKDVADLQGWSSFRLRKFYEALDALTADGAYTHVGRDRGLALVTAGHAFSRKLGRTPERTDLTLRSYVTSTGSSSLEVRTDAIQIVGNTEVLRNFCHTTMVAVDEKTLKPVKGAVPPLLLKSSSEDLPRQEARRELALEHARIRKRRAKESVSLFTPKLSKPPTQSEMNAIHELHYGKRGSSRVVAVAEHTHSDAFVVFPESRNVHGKTFGGYALAQAFDLAYFAASSFVGPGKNRFAPLGLDEANFLHPVSIGDHIKVTARVVHSCVDTGVFRVSVFITQLGGNLQRTNFLRFVFAAEPHTIDAVLPETYEEILGHVSAARRHNEEPISPTGRSDLDAFFSEQLQRKDN